MTVKNMKEILIGSTGFVGGNLLKSHSFDGSFHSSNIDEAYGTNPELCIYSGVPSAMFLANSNPTADFEVIENAFYNIKKINPKKLVLISSIAVYDDSRQKDEDSNIDDKQLSAYGKNRLHLERLVRDKYSNCLIVRLPALYGYGLKKNFLYDLHTITPFMLKPEKYEELSKNSDLVKLSYSFADNGFYKLLPNADKKALKSFFETNDFNALAFTDSHSKFQFYNLSNLWKDIKTALDNNISCLNITTPPVSAKEIYRAVTGKDNWNNELNCNPFDYDLRSKHCSLFGGSNGYLYSLEDEIEDICRFMREWK